jgi:predicted nucleic acid-binding protein
VVDTSVAIALVVVDHAHHTSVTDAIGDLRLGLAGHAAFETYSVLTRLPPPVRRTPAAVRRLLADNFPSSVFLSPSQSSRLLDSFATMGISGGAVYDGLVAAAASAHGIPLATRDARAMETYRTLQADARLIG